MRKVFKSISGIISFSELRAIDMQGKNNHAGVFRNWLSRSGWMDDLELWMIRVNMSNGGQRSNPNSNGLTLQGKV